MPVHRQLTVPQLRRLKAWLVCVSDASSYLAIARTNEELIDQGAFIEHGTGETRIGHALEKGLVAAAIISLMQIVVTGKGSNDICSNRDLGTIGEIRAALYQYSDQKNGWGSGHTEKLLEETRLQRHAFLAHYDGSKAAIKLTENADPLSFSWCPPNPWYRADAFSELDAATTAMHEILNRIVSDQSEALRNSSESP